MKVEKVHEKNIERVVEQIKGQPRDWVLILGEDISKELEFSNSEKREEFSLEVAKEMINRNEVSEQEKENIYKAVQNKEMRELESIIYGDVWDGTRFLEWYQEIKKDCREKKLGKWLINIDRINVEMADESHSLINILKVFKGIILTTCQDEVVEAFLEYNKAMPIDDTDVCTPHLLLTSPKWQAKMRRFLDESAIENERREDGGSVLMKLYGSRDNPKRLLLSNKDFEMYYPQERRDLKGLIYTTKFLRKLWEKKYFLFIGMKTKKNLQGEDIISIAPEVENIWEETYTRTEKEKYWIQQEDIEKFQEKIREAFESMKNEEESHKTNIDTRNIFLDKEKVLQKFWELYVRRSVYSVSYTEKQILEQRIENKNWNVKDIEMLAIIANNLADFYDLQEVLSEDKENREEFGRLAERIIKEKFKDDSKIFYHILCEYGPGFPSSFLNLFSEKENGSVINKRTAILLINSGICTKGHQRKNIHRRMKHADDVMMTAGTSTGLEKQRVKRDIEEIDKKISNGYFFVTDTLKDNTILRIPRLTGVEDVEKEMCKKLLLILKKKNKDYNHFRALLETEIPQLLQLLQKMQDDDIKWKIEVIYWIFTESRIVCVGTERNYIEELLKKISQVKDNTPEEIEWKLKKIQLYVANSILLSQSREMQKQEEALEYCKKAEIIIRRIDKNLIREDIFKIQIQIYLLKSKIEGRKNAIQFWRKGANLIKRIGEKNEKEEWLNEAKEKIDVRAKRLGKNYSRLGAQLAYAEGKKTLAEFRYLRGREKINSQKLKKKYEEAQKKYEEALKYYDEYSERFDFQRADIMKNYGELLCWAINNNSQFQSRGELRKKCYDLLYSAYKIYRRNASLHGIANVLYTMGNMEDYVKYKEGRKRSSFCFYNAAKEIYRHLGDDWGEYIVEKAVEQAEEFKNKVERL